MRIAILGAGAMGALYGAYLSRKNDVLLIDVNQQVVDKINAEGVTVEEKDGTRAVFHPSAAVDTAAMKPVDLMIVFVKAMFSEAALQNNAGLIGANTFLMTLQNGSGHEEVLSKFVDREHVIIGTTQHNCAVLGLGEIRHGGSGLTHMGCLDGNVQRILRMAETFTACGLEADCQENVQRLIWQKLFTNVSASALTAVLQVPLGYIAENPNAWAVCEKLVREAVAVANADGMGFDADEKVEEVHKVCVSSPKGITSICADLKNGRRSEVDTISGSVVRASRRNGMPAPTHEAIVNLIHALEARPKDIL